MTGNETVEIRGKQDVPSTWGKLRKALNKGGAISKRDPNGESETYTSKSGQDCTAVRGTDYIVVYPDGQLGSPRDVVRFHKDYVETSPGSNQWVKNAEIEGIPVPAGITATVYTRDKAKPDQQLVETVIGPDWIMFDGDGHPYENKVQFVRDNLKSIDGEPLLTE